MGKIKVKDAFDALRKIVDIASNLTTATQVQMAIDELEARKAALATPPGPGNQA